MKIAILGAMSEEIAPLLEHFGEYEKVDYAANEFYLTSFANHDLVLAYSKIGKVNSALTASVMFEKFGCEAMLFTGVAGALEEGLNIGDLLFATQTAQHDLDISVFGHPKGFVPGGSVFCKTDERLNLIAQNTAAQLGINLKSGVIASGDIFVCDETSKQNIKTEFNAAATEMEGASVAVVCDALQKPFFLLRAISDTASGGAEIDFDEFVQSSAKTSAKFIISMLNQI